MEVFIVILKQTVFGSFIKVQHILNIYHTRITVNHNEVFSNKYLIVDNAILFKLLKKESSLFFSF